MTRTQFAAVAFIASTTLSCAGGPDTAPVTVVQDSTNVAVTTYNDLSHAKPPVWKLSAEPTVRIGVADGDSAYQFYNVRGATRLSDGTIVVGDDSHTLRYFDPQGKLIRKVGSDGKGPGQFQMIFLMGAFAGDSLIIHDSVLRRVSVFGPDGVLAREFPLGQKTGWPPLATGLLQDGTLVANLHVSHSPSNGYRQDTLEVLLIRPDGKTRLSLGRFAGNESGATTERTKTGMRAWRNTLLFGRKFVLRGAADRLFIGMTDNLNIPAYDAAGTLCQVLRSTEPLQASKKDMLDRFHEYVIDNLRENGASDEAITGQRQRLEGDDIAPTLPAFSDLLATHDGGLWVKQYRLPWDEGPSTWWIFDRDNKLVGTIELPPNFDLYEVQGGRVLGVETDDMDVEYIADYRLEREAVDGS